MSRRGYYFVIDSVVAIMILTMGYMVISAYSPHSSTEVFQETLANDIMEVLGTTSMHEICPGIAAGAGCCTNIPAIDCSNKRFTNLNNTILEVFGEVYSRNPSDVPYIEAMLDDLIDGNRMVRRDIYGVRVDLIDGGTTNLLYRIGDDSDKRIRNMVSVERVIFGYHEVPATGAITYWGPYTIRLEVWQRP